MERQIREQRARVPAAVRVAARLPAGARMLLKADLVLHAAYMPRRREAGPLL